jgi:hypothetical protein
MFITDNKGEIEERQDVIKETDDIDRHPWFKARFDKTNQLDVWGTIKQLTDY